MLRISLTYVCTLAALLILDGVWLTMVAAPLFQATLGDLMLSKVRPVPAVLFYLLYAVGILTFVHALGQTQGLKGILAYGALFGLIAYGTYDFTNYTTLRVWTLNLVLVDLFWGCLATAIASAVGWWGGAKLTAFF